MRPFSSTGFNNPFYPCNPGDAALDQLREDKETVENEVRLSDLGLVSFILLQPFVQRWRDEELCRHSRAFQDVILYSL